MLPLSPIRTPKTRQRSNTVSSGTSFCVLADMQVIAIRVPASLQDPEKDIEFVVDKTSLKRTKSESFMHSWDYTPEFRPVQKSEVRRMASGTIPFWKPLFTCHQLKGRSEEF